MPLQALGAASIISEKPRQEALVKSLATLLRLFSVEESGGGAIDAMGKLKNNHSVISRLRR